MRITDLLIRSWRSVLRRPGRALLTIVAVGIGAFTFAITSALGIGVNEYIESQTRSVGATDTVQVAQTSPQSFLNERMEEYDPSMADAGVQEAEGILTESDVDAVRETIGDEAEVVASGPVQPLYFNHNGGEKYRFIYNGNWPGKTANLAAGDQLTDEAEEPRLVIPEYSVEPLGFDSPEDAVGQSVTVGVLGADGDVREMDAAVSGVQVRSLIGGNLPFGNQAFGAELEELSAEGQPAEAQGVATHLFVTGPDVADVRTAVEEEGYTVSTAEDIVGDYQLIVSAVLLVLNILASIAILAAMFGIVNTLLMSVQEKTRHIGMMRALGMPRRTVFLSIAVEALVLAVIGAVGAVVLALVVGLTVGPALPEAVGLDLPGLELFRFEPVSVLLIIVGVLAAAVIAALLPAARAARLEPMDALREVN